jgi:DNA-binding NtrC family response regulator
MPTMSGMDLYTRVQGIDPELIRSLIFIVGEAADPVVQSFLDVTRSEYIARPFKMDDVLSSIDRVLELKAETVNASSAFAERLNR